MVILPCTSSLTAFANVSERVALSAELLYLLTLHWFKSRRCALQYIERKVTKRSCPPLSCFFFVLFNTRAICVAVCDFVHSFFVATRLVALLIPLHRQWNVLLDSCAQCVAPRKASHCLLVVGDNASPVPLDFCFRAEACKYFFGAKGFDFEEPHDRQPFVFRSYFAFAVAVGEVQHRCRITQLSSCLGPLKCVEVLSRFLKLAHLANDGCFEFFRCRRCGC